MVSECAIESQINNSKNGRIKKCSNQWVVFLVHLAPLKLDEIVTEGFCLRTQPIATPTVQNLLVGEYSLFWKRFVSL